MSQRNSLRPVRSAFHFIFFHDRCITTYSIALRTHIIVENITEDNHLVQTTIGQMVVTPAGFADVDAPGLNFVVLAPAPFAPLS